MEKDYLQVIYGDTDSCAKDSVLITDRSKMTIEELFNKSDLIGSTINGTQLAKTDVKIINWSNDKGIHFTNINYISRHKVSKEKWVLKTKSGKIIEVTGDHSLIVFRNGVQKEVKPREILNTDKILTLSYES